MNCRDLTIINISESVSYFQLLAFHMGFSGKITVRLIMPGVLIEDI